MAAARRRPRPSFAIGSVRVRAGSRQEVSLPISRLVTGAEVSLPVHVLHGREEGPTVGVGHYLARANAIRMLWYVARVAV